MAGYTITFSGDRSKSIKNSKREYRAGWLITLQGENYGPNTFMGFARDHGMAEAAAHRESRFFIRNYGARITELEVVAAAKSEA